MIEELKKIAMQLPRVARARVAAAIVINGSQWVGYNSIKSHPFQKRFASNENAIHLHAEIDAIRNFLSCYSAARIRHTTLYIARMKYEDQTKKIMIPGLAKPCVGCQRAIATFGIKNVCYTTEDGIEWL